MGSDKHLHWEEDFHSDELKMNRKDRKFATSRDRSKYKKTDQDKRPQHSPQQKEGFRGLVTTTTPEGIIVYAENKIFLCQLKGQLKQERNLQKNLIAVGDFVWITPSNEKEGVITYIEPRYSTLSRADNLSRKKEQFIAVNIDQVLIITSVVSPPLKPSLIDRYIIAAQKGNLHPVIVINKIDLLKTPPASASKEEIDLEQILFEEMLATYSSLDIPIYAISTTSGEGIEKLKTMMNGKQSVLSGQSGVGKSSLINLLTGGNIAIGGIVERTSKGSHTTTTTQLIPLIGGGFCIDTPGIRSFGVWDLDKQELQHYFTEIFQEAKHCKYPDCSHTIEPDCAVVRALEDGKISSLRFASYCALMEDLSQEHRNR